MSVEIKIVRKPGWILNPNDKTVNAIFRALEKNWWSLSLYTSRKNWSRPMSLCIIS